MQIMGDESMNKRPEAGEFNPYYSTYVHLVQDGEIGQTLTQQMKETISLLENLSEEQAAFRYGPDKWSVKEVLGHIADTERIMSFRLLSFARGETAGLTGFNENEYVRVGEFDRQTVRELLDNLAAVRTSTVHLLKSLTEDDWKRSGTANGSEVTVNALAWIIAGHELHHRKILNERYFKAEGFPENSSVI